jgi:hypothetical protein
MVVSRLVVMVRLLFVLHALLVSAKEWGLEQEKLQRQRVELWGRV